MLWILFCFCFYCCAVVDRRYFASLAVLLLCCHCYTRSFLRFHHRQCTVYTISSVVLRIAKIQFGAEWFDLSHVSNVYTVHVLFLYSFHSIIFHRFMYGSGMANLKLIVIIINERSSSTSNTYRIIESVHHIL